MPKRRHQTGLSEQTNVAKLLEIENDGPVGGCFAQDAHHAVTAGIGVFHDAGITRNHEDGLVAAGMG